jgi:ribosomal protein L15
MALLSLFRSFSSSFQHPITAANLPRIHNEQRRKKLGRGGQGATAGRGRKGWKARHGGGGVMRAFAGGQTTIARAFKKFGPQMREGLIENRQSLRPVGVSYISEHSWTNYSIG